MRSLLVSLLALAVAGGCASQRAEPSRSPSVAARSSAYVPMSDGAMLAVELFLPAAAKRGASVPAILKLARFGRLEGGKISAEESAWLDHGYALVLADLRGTGASTGTSRYGRSELPDLRQLARWIASQPWSNGRIGAYGTSFQGTAAELLAATGEPSVAAVAPLFSDFEYYGDLVRPGGVLHAGLVTDLGAFMKAMDAGESARAVESDTGGAILRQALKDHAGNLDLAASARAAVFADDPVPGLGGSLADTSVAAIQSQIGRHRVPMFVHVAWFDAGTVRGALQRFAELPNVQQLSIGPWSHGGGYIADSLRGVASPDAQGQSSRRAAILSFFDSRLKGPPKGGSKTIRYYTLGAGCWRSSDVWPPRGNGLSRFHLLGGGLLSQHAGGAPQTVRLTGTDTGRSNRWRTQFGGDAVDYTAAAERMQSLPGFTTAPFATAKEVTGSPVLDLRLRLAAQPAQEPAVFAYLFAIDPAGRPHYLSEGQLMLRHRKAASGTTRLHTYRRRDALPVTSGEAMDVRIPLLPISALVPAGGRLKLLLASGDTPTFEVTPSYEASILPSSSLELPLAERRQDMCRSSRG